MSEKEPEAMSYNRTLRTQVLTVESVGWLVLSTFGIALVIAGLVAPEYLVYVMTSWVISGILGMSLSVVWGRGGILSFAQTVFFGLGGYVGGVLAINFTGMTGNSVMWLLPAGALTGALAAAAVGYFIFYGRLSPFPMTIVTYCLVLIVWTLSLSFTQQVGSARIGGNNGMIGIPQITLAFGDQAAPLDIRAMFLFALLLAAGTYLLTKALLARPFGRIIDAVREDPEKAELIGYNVPFYRLLLFAYGGGIAGMGGALFGSWAQFLTPSVFSISAALLVPVYVVLGGMSYLPGAFVGAFLIGGLSFWLGNFGGSQHTMAIVGLTMIIFVLVLKQGILGSLARAVEFALPTSSEPRVDIFESLSGAHRREVLRGLITKLYGDGERQKSATLSVESVSKRFGGHVAVKNVTVTLQKPGKIAVIGPNGAGKSTLLNAIVGINRVDTGRIALDEKDLDSKEIYERVEQGVAAKLQRPQIFSGMTVADNLFIAAYSRSRNVQEASEIVEIVSGILGLPVNNQVKAGSLSHGAQQLLDICMVMCLKPSVILFDEPGAGITRLEKTELARVIDALSAAALVVVVDHDMNFIRELKCDVIVMNRGEIFVTGSMEEIEKNDDVGTLYFGEQENA